MSYVGNKPALKYVNFAVQHFSTSATTSYTLDQSVSNEVEIALFINNVRQEPGSSYAYTATGTALTLSQATAGSDTMYCVFIGKAVETNNPPAGSVNTSELVDNAVTTAKITSDSVTYDKIQDLASANRVLGGASTGTVGEVQVVDGMTNFVSTSSASGLQIKGDGTTDGTLQLNCSQNTHGIKIKSPPHSANATYTLTMPTTDGNTSEFLQTNGSGTLTWATAGGGGITVADQWRLTTTTNSGTDADITSNWERADAPSGYGSIGSAMTQSSGIFTFPSTGIYLISTSFYIVQSSDVSATIRLKVTTDNSSYNDASIANANNSGNSTAPSLFIFDVTNTSNCKAKFATTSFASGTSIYGETAVNYSAVLFMRLGDT